VDHRNRCPHCPVNMPTTMQPLQSTCKTDTRPSLWIIAWVVLCAVVTGLVQANVRNCQRRCTVTHTLSAATNASPAQYTLRLHGCRGVLRLGVRPSPSAFLLLER
jgi:hypothetical protein